jgi:hypothetical protein
MGVIMRALFLAILFFVIGNQGVEALGLNPLPGYITVYYQLLDKNGTITMQKMANSGWNQVGVVGEDPEGQMHLVETGEYFFIYWADLAAGSRFDIFAVKVKRGDPISKTRDDMDFDKLGSFQIPNEYTFHFNEKLPAGWQNFKGQGAYATVKAPNGGTLRILVLYHKYQNQPTFRR